MIEVLQLMTGVDIPAPEFETIIHQPSIIEISRVGELAYFSAIQTLCFNKKVLMADNSQGSSSLANMSDFQIFMTLVSDQRSDPDGKLKNNLVNALTLHFPYYIMQFLPNGLYFNNVRDKKNFVVDENNFTIFQDYVKQVSGVASATGGENSNFNPVNEKAAAIAAKLMRGRSRVAQQKGEGTTNGVLARYASILTVGLQSMSLKDCLELTVFQLYDLIERYGLYVGWDIDIRSRLAGGKPDSKPDDWMKGIH